MIQYSKMEEMKWDCTKKGKYFLVSTMPGGQTKRISWKDQDISGLWNQGKRPPLHSDATSQSMPPQLQVPSPKPSDPDEDDLEFFNHFDSLKADFQQAEDWPDKEEDEELEDMDELLELSEKDLTKNMVELLIDDDNDLDWIPEKLQKKAEMWRKAAKCELNHPQLSLTFTNLKAAQPKVYAKGPDVMSKSKWTQEWYWRQNWDQSSLTAFRFTANWAEIKSKVSNQPSILLNEPNNSTHSIVELLSPQIPGFSHAQSASVLSNPSSDDQWNDLLFKEVAEGDKVVREVGDLEDDSKEEYESELEEARPQKCCLGLVWSSEKIEVHLVKHKNDLPLLQVNQYLILSNFVTSAWRGWSKLKQVLRFLTSGKKAQKTGLHIGCRYLPNIWGAPSWEVWWAGKCSHFYIMRLSKFNCPARSWSCFEIGFEWKDSLMMANQAWMVLNCSEVGCVYGWAWV